jgi:hypothetical protein
MRTEINPGWVIGHESGHHRLIRDGVLVDEGLRNTLRYRPVRESVKRLVKCGVGAGTDAVMLDGRVCMDEACPCCYPEQEG